MRTGVFEYRMKVRDYECDMQGIVNNANYLHYLEHARHEFLQKEHMSFADLHNRGIECVVARIDISYKVPLRSGDEFLCGLFIKKEGVKYVFVQTIERAEDHKLIARAKVDIVCVINGRLSDCEELNKKIEKYFEE